MILQYGFSIAEHYEMLKYILKKVDIIVQPHDKDGFLKVSKTSYDTGKLSDKMTSVLDRSLTDFNDKQFIISQLVHPNALFDRLLDKNLPKSNRIQKFFSNNHLKFPSYLLNEPRVLRTLKRFLNELSQHMNTIWNKYKHNLHAIESTIKLYYDAQHDLSSGIVNLFSMDDVIRYANKFKSDTVCDFNAKLNAYLIIPDRGIINYTKKVLDIIEFIYASHIKRFQDMISEMILEYDILYAGSNIGRLNAQFEEIVKTPSSQILLSKIAINFDQHVAERIKVMKSSKTSSFLYKLSKLSYDKNAYNKLLSY